MSIDKNLLQPRWILVSVSNKEKLENFIKDLSILLQNINIVASLGTYNYLKERFKENTNISLISIETYIGQKELEGGLVKTLDKKVFTAILSEPENIEHQNTLREFNTEAFDMIICNLYDFDKDVRLGDIKNKIDIGGHALLRAGAKAFSHIIVVSKIKQYKKIIKEIKKYSGIGLETRLKLASSVFKKTAKYDLKINSAFKKLVSKWRK